MDAVPALSTRGPSVTSSRDTLHSPISVMPMATNRLPKIQVNFMAPKYSLLLKSFGLAVIFRLVILRLVILMLMSGNTGASGVLLSLVSF